jgi:hypothetical protein
MSIRIQRKRSKGWRMPENTVYVGSPTKWGNPMSTAWEYKRIVEALKPDVSELKGKNLACWCPLDKPCHADVLLELAK